MPNAASSATVRREERRRCFRRKVLDNGEMVSVDLGPMESGLLLDISSRGASVQGLKPLRPGVRISMKFRLPASQVSVQPTYEVVWATPDGRIGLKFLYIAEREQRLLNEWAALHLPPDAVSETSEAPQSVAAPAVEAVAPAPAEASSMTLAEELARVAQQVCTYTSADGAAVALRQEQGIVCRASWGNAPDVGVVLDPEAGLSGECIRTGAVVQCADASSDARVDPIAARQLNLRSVLIVPIAIEGEVQGLLEVISSRASAFRAEHRNTLERLAEIVAFLVGPPATPPAPSSVPAPTAASTAAAPQEVSADETVPTPAPAIAIHSADPEQPAPANDPGAAAEASALSGLPSNEVAGILRLIEPELSAPAALPEEFTEPKPAPAREAARATTPETVREALPSFARGFDPRRHWNITLIVAAIALCALLATLAGWLLGVHKAAKITAAPLTSATTAPPAPIALPETVSAPATTAPALPNPPARTRPVKSTSHSTAPDSSEPEVVTWIGGDESGPVPSSSKPSAVPETAAPPLVGLPGAAANLAAIPTAAPAAPGAPARPRPINTAPLRVTSEVMMERAIVRASPVYPEAARRAGISGRVALRVIVTADGKVEMATPVSGSPMLAAAAVTAVKQWHFRPYLQDSKPIRVETTINIVFRHE